MASWSHDLYAGASYVLIAAILRRVFFEQENSAKLTNQRVSYAFTSSPLTFHARHILPTSKLQHRHSCILLIFYTTDISEQHVWEMWVWIQSTGLTLPQFLFGNPNEYPHNTYITSSLQSLGYIFCCRWQYMRSSANFRTVFSESQNANPFDVELEPDFNAKWPFKVIHGHPFRCQLRATKGLHSTI